MHGRRATSLVEMMIASVILIIVVAPVGLMLTGSTNAVQRVDLQREVRTLLEHVIERAEAQDFGVLYDSFGGSPVDGLTRGELNPLEVDPDVLARMKELGLSAALTFRFFTKSEVKDTGLLWLQGGVLRLRLKGPGVDEAVERTVYCPLILGRPGLLLNQCPAVDPQKKAKFESLGVR